MPMKIGNAWSLDAAPATATATAAHAAPLTVPTTGGRSTAIGPMPSTPGNANRAPGVRAAGRTGRPGSIRHIHAAAAASRSVDTLTSRPTHRT
jgi:hypothetical protein